MDWPMLAALAERAATKAASLLVERAREPARGVTSKSSATDMVSEADRASERLLRDLIRQQRPDDALQGEEGTHSRGSTGLTWVIDPLDGTTNYLYRLPQWAVSIACEDTDGAGACCVVDPNRNEVFVASRGGGATLNGAVISVGVVTSLQQALIGTGFAYEPKLRTRQAEQLRGVIGRVRDVRRAGSAALDLAWLACGRLDGFYESDIRHWDWAAGALLVREAGGVFSVSDGPLGVPQVVAANRRLYPRLTRLVAASATTLPCQTSDAPPAARGTRTGPEARS